MRRGFTLIETIVGLAIFLVVVLAGLESFGTARGVFFRLRDAQEARLAALGALDKIKADLLQAGRGLSTFLRLGLVPSLEEAADGWAFWNAETAAFAAEDLRAGQVFIAVSGMAEAAAGRKVGFSDGGSGEIATVLESSRAGITLASPLTQDYPAERTSIVLLRRVMISFDRPGAVLRRKVNAASSQPLVEDVADFGLVFDPPSARVEIRLEMKGKVGVHYDTAIAAKNLALAR